MKMTETERLILLMLAEFYEKNEMKVEIHQDQVDLRSLNKKSYEHKYFVYQDLDTLSLIKEVVNILDMWLIIQKSYAFLTSDKKETLEKNIPYIGNDPVFTGFDGFYESEHMKTSLYLASEIERFKKLKVNDFNSRSPSIDGYRRMLSVFQPIHEKVKYKLLNVCQLSEVLIEKNFPT